MEKNWSNAENAATGADQENFVTKYTMYVYAVFHIDKWDLAIKFTIGTLISEIQQW